MIRLEDVERRNSKIIQQRFGISAIYDTMEDNILNQEIYECTKKSIIFFQIVLFGIRGGI